MPPNVLLIIADDMGKEQFSEEEQSGSSPGYPALPTIQDIGNRGVRYTRFYVTPFCSPTRACVNTGRYAGRTGLGDIVETEEDEPLLPGEFTLAELVKEYTANQYATAFIGKYHLGNSQDGGGLAANLQGWDYSCITERNLDTDSVAFPVNPNYEATRNFPYFVNGEARENVDTFCGTWTTNNALDWIRRQGDRPWLCVVSYHMPHDPFARPPLTHFDPLTWNCPLLEPPTQGGPTTTPYFKAMEEALEYEVTQLLEGIAAYSGDVFDNTMQIFMPDNGTAGDVLGEETYPDDTSYQANHGKRTCYEPGVCVPLYINGPLVTAMAGTEVTGLVHAVDLFGLIAQICGVTDPSDYLTTRKGIDHDFVDIYDTLSGTTTTSRTNVFCEIFVPNGADGASEKLGQRAMISDQYKLYRKAVSATGIAEFYDRVADPKEENNLTPGGDTSGLSAAELAAYTELDDAMAAFYASVS